MIDLVPVAEDHSATPVLISRLVVSVPCGLLTSMCTRSEMNWNAEGGSRSCRVASCGSTVAGSNTRP